MSDLLAIAGPIDRDEELVEEVARRHPSEVTIVIGEPAERDAWAIEETPGAREIRDRLARLLSLVEARTGAAVMGGVGDLRPLRGRWFDSIVDPGLPSAALP